MPWNVVFTVPLFVSFQMLFGHDGSSLLMTRMYKGTAGKKWEEELL
jgi:hypothetical protein